MMIKFIFICIVFFVLQTEGAASPQLGDSEEERQPQRTVRYVLAQNGTIIKVEGPQRPPPTLAEVKDSMEFWLHPNGRENGVKIDRRSSETIAGYFPGCPLYIICHGFTSNSKDFGGAFLGGFRHLSEEYEQDLNVIVINWKNLAKGPDYTVAAHNVGPVGTETACLVRHLIALEYTSLELIHFIGHSLGSHVGNHLANAVNSKCGAGQKIGRITALDPALPLFSDIDDRRRIDRSDAEFVDVIHSAKGLLGFAEPRGHQDFYPNDGAAPQPGCPTELDPTLEMTLPAVVKDIMKYIKAHICSHSRAVEYFVESLYNPAAFYACKCKNWGEYNSGSCPCFEEALMGIGASNEMEEGTYFLKTNEDSPFGKGSHKGLQTKKEFKLRRKPHKRQRLGVLAL